MLSRLKFFKTKLEGRKTYITSITIILIGLAKWAGIDIPGVDVGNDPLNWVLSGLGLAFLRAGVQKVK